MLPDSFSTPLFTDLYQVTMAYAYWKLRTHEKEAVFHLFFRHHPFRGGFTVACGLQQVIEYLRNFKFQPDDLEYLGGLKGNDEQPLFERRFLDYLRDLKFLCDLDRSEEHTSELQSRLH